MNEPPNPEVAVFAAALELPADQRGAYLDEACAGDAALRRQVEALLRVHDDAGNFFDKLAPVGRSTPAEEAKLGPSGTIRLSCVPTAKAGDRIGRFKLLQQIGEGGCGVVYMAEQEEPVRRRVALKVIKLGMDTKSVIARFEAERQALALMDHPNVAKVLEAGATETGRPYFVMELVRGIKITDYCDENDLNPKARLEIFILVCQAIQHAHQKGIIHRDIKPSNILVADHDGRAVPKIIDFGIAKATTDQRLTDKTLFTALEQFIGTPAYMSPEQARLSGLDIDTRSDIYSLGVLLYELLTARTPFETKRLHEIGLDEIRRIIREEEPVRPSTKLETLDAAEKITVAKHRQSDPPKLAHLIRGDLDWIVMKALEKDRTRRYETANGLASDVRRYLNCEAIVARPPSRWYEFQKTVRRHRFGFGAAAAVFVVLTAGVAVSTSEVVRARRAEQEQIRLRETAQKETEFIKGMLKTTLPQTGTGTNVPINLAILDQLPNAPETEAELRTAVADAYMDLGRYDEASVMRNRVSILQGMLGGGNPPASSQNGVTPTVNGAAALLSAALAALAVVAIKRRLRLLTYVFIPLSLWAVAMVLGLAETGSLVRLAVWSLTGVVIGIFGMMVGLRRTRRLRAGATSVEAMTNEYPVRPWVDALAGLGFFVVLVLAIYGFEDWRGKRAWENCKRDLEAKGAKLDWDYYTPGPVPVDQNIFGVPEMQKWFEGREKREFPVSLIFPGYIIDTNAGLKRYPGYGPSTNLFRIEIARLMIGLPGMIPPDGYAVLQWSDAKNATAEAARLIKQTLGPMAADPAGFAFIAKKPKEVRPAQIFLQCQTAPTLEELQHFLPNSFNPTPNWPVESDKDVRIEQTGANSFRETMLAPLNATDYVAWGATIEPELNTIRQALRRPYARLEGNYEDSELIPNFLNYKIVCQRLAALAECYLLLGQPEKALDEMTFLNQMRRSLEFRPTGKRTTLVSAMMNVAITGLYVATMQDGMRLEAWREPQLAALQAQLGEVNLRPYVAAGISFELPASIHALKRMDKAEQRKSITTEFWWSGSQRETNFLKLGLTRLIPQGWIYQNLVVYANLENKVSEYLPGEREDISPHKIDIARASIDAAVARPSPFNLMAATATLNFSRSLLNLAHSQTEATQAQIVCALERYRLAHGEYPSSLEALVPQYIDKIPRDFIGGQTPRYHRTDGGKFLLYSIGWTETDHGGQIGSKAEEGDWVWMDDAAAYSPPGLVRAKLTPMTLAPLFPPAVDTNLTAGNELIDGVQFDQIPLSNAVADLAKQTQVKIQFDPVIVNQKAADGTPILNSNIKENWKKVTAWQALQALLDNFGWQMTVTPGPGILVTAKDTNAIGPVEMPIKLLENLGTNGTAASGIETADVAFDDMALAEAIRQLALLAELNIQFDPRLANQLNLKVNEKWDKVTERQALQRLLDNHGWQMIQIPGNPIFRVVPKNP